MNVSSNIWAKPIYIGRTMAGVNRKISTTGIFLAVTLTLLLYLVAMRYQLHLPVQLFFITIGLMIVTVLYQCFALELSPRFAGVVLIEIMLCSLVFHLIYQVPNYGLYGSDAYLDLASLKAILISGNIRGIPDYVQLTSYFPMIHILGAGISLVTGIDSFEVAKWFPSLIDVGTIPFLYLLVRHIFRDERVALLSALLFASLQHHVLFGSLFVRETIALLLMISCVYLYISARSSQHPVAYRALSLFLLAGTVLAHHFTSLMLIVFLLVQWLVSSLSRLPSLQKGLLKNVTGEKTSLSFLLIAAVGTFTYWITTVVEPVQILTTYIQNLFNPSVWGTYTYLEQSSLSLPTFRYYILIYGSYICYLVFGLLLLQRLTPKAGNRYLETYSFTLFLIFCGVAGVISFYLLPATVAGDRFLSFGWLFAFGPLALAILENRHESLRVVGSFFLVLFIFLNMYTIHPTLWNPNANGSGGAAGKQDFALAETLNFSKGGVLANLNDIMPIYDIQNKMGTDAFALSDPIDIRDFDWVIVNRRGLKEEELHSAYSATAIADMELLQEQGSPSFDKKYVSNNLAVFKRK